MGEGEQGWFWALCGEHRREEPATCRAAGEGRPSAGAVRRAEEMPDSISCKASSQHPQLLTAPRSCRSAMLRLAVPGTRWLPGRQRMPTACLHAVLSSTAPKLRAWNALAAWKSKDADGVAGVSCRSIRVCFATISCTATIGHGGVPCEAPGCSNRRFLPLSARLLGHGVLQ